MKRLLFFYWILFFQGIIFAQSFSSREFNFIDMEDGFPSNEIYHCYEDKRGVLWFGTDNGVVRYNGNELKLYSVKEGLEIPMVYWFYELDDGSLFAESYFGQYFCIRDDKVTSYEFNDTIVKYFGSNNFAYSFYQDEKGNKHFGNKLGYLALDPNGNVLKHVAPYTGEERRRILSFSLKGETFFSYRTLVPKGEEKYNVRWVTEEDTVKYWIDFNEANSISTRGERFGQNWVFNRNKSVLLLTSDGKLKSFEQPYEPIMINNVGGDLYVSTLKGGTYIYDIVDEELVLKDSFFSGLSVTTVLQTPDSLFWVTTKEKGLAKEVNANLRVAYEVNDKANIRIYRKTADYELIGLEDGTLIKIEDGVEREYKFNTIIYDVINLSKDTVFVMAGEGGLLDLKTGEFLNESAGDLNRSDHYSFSRGVKSDNFFVGAYTNDISVFKRQKGELKFLIESNIPDRIFGYEIFNGYLYVGHKKGISVFNLQTLDLITEINEIGDVMDLKVLNNHVIGSSFSGEMIVFADSSNYQTFELPENNRMSLYSLYCEDETVLTTYSEGVYSWNLIDGDWRITDFYGIPAHIFCTTSYGDSIYLITSRTIYSIPKRGNGKMAPKIYLQSVEVNKDSVNFNQEITLDHGTNNLKFTYESVGYLTDDHLFRYRLKNHDLGFIYTNELQVYYSALPSGEYTFEVQSTMDGFIYSKSVLLSFTIRAPYWQKWWFYLSIVLVLIGLISFLYRLRLRNLKRMNKLNLSVLELKAQALTAQLNPHLVFNILNSIQGMIVRSDREEANNALADFARYLRNALDLSKRSTIPLFDEIAVTQQYIDLELIRFPEGLTITLDEITENAIELPPLIIQPLIENAIKHGIMPSKTGQQGEVSISFAFVADRLKIKVMDNGCGVRDESTLFSGDGLRIVLERIKNLNPKNSLTYARISNTSVFIITICK